MIYLYSIKRRIRAFNEVAGFAVVCPITSTINSRRKGDNQIAKYIAYDIMRTKIEFLKRQSDQKKPVLELINQIQEQGKTDQDVLQLFKLIMRGLEFVERHGMPLVKQMYLTAEREDGRPYTIQIVKELRHHVPLMEFRINWVGTGAFRSVFFEHQVGDLQQYINLTGVDTNEKR